MTGTDEDSRAPRSSRISKAERIDELRCRIRDSDQKLRFEELGAEFGGRASTVSGDVRKMLHRHDITMKQVLDRNLVDRASLSVLEPCLREARSTSRQERQKLVRTWATILLNEHDDDYSEKQAFIEASLILSAQRVKDETAKQMELSYYDDEHPAPLPEEEREHYVVCTKSKCRSIHDLYVRESNRNAFFMYSSELKVMVYWKNPRVILYRRTGTVTFDETPFYCIDEHLLKVLAEDSRTIVPIRTERMVEGDIDL